MPSNLKNIFFRPKKSRSQSSLPAASQLNPESRGYSQAAAPQGFPEPLAQPTETIVDTASTTTELPVPATPIRKDQNYGVKVLYDGGTEARVDIVFVHGLTGNAYSTWLHEDTGIHWPSKLLKQDIPDARILSYGYDADIVKFWNPASNSRLSNHAENMVGDLVRYRERTNTEPRKILFVAHSLGGLVTEYALGFSRKTVEEHLHQLESCTAGIVFLGVPHCGADLASWASFGTQMVNILKRANEDIVRVLKPGSEILRMVENDFHNILRQRKAEGSEISVTCFYEELHVTGVGEIVPLHSAEIKGYNCYGIHANHMHMTKFPHREDPGYDRIIGELQRWKKKVPVDGPQSDHNPSRALTHWMAPRAVSNLYTGRRELGVRLTQAFQSDHLTPRTFVITGLGGTGKSEICLKFAEDHQDEYWGILWLNASSIATAEQGYIDIGRQCGVFEPSVETVKSWLACNSQRWLLVIDNADNPAIDYSKYKPYGGRGDILLTSRNPDCVRHGTVGSESLEGLEADLARELLLRATLISEDLWKEKAEAAMAVVHILGLHTLAIIQAGAFIKKKLCTLEGYPTLFKQQKRELLNFQSVQMMSEYGNVYATFEVSAEYLQNSKTQEHLDALDFLHTLAFMHNNGVSETLFQMASEYALELKDRRTSNDEEVLSLSFRHIARLPEYAQQWSLSFHNRMRWRKACSILASLSIITVDEDSDSLVISVHSLVHAWAKERQEYQNRCQSWQSAAMILALSCKSQYPYGPHFVFLHPHVRACVSHEIEDYTRDMSNKEVTQILFRFAHVLLRMRDITSLDSLVQRIRLRLQNRDEADQGIALQIQVFTGIVFLGQGKHAEAVNILRENHDSRTRALADDHPSWLDLQHSLGQAYLANEQTGESIKLLKHVVKAQEKLAENHSDRLASQHLLARAYHADKQIDKAVKLLEHVVKIREKLAEDHPSRLASQHELACVYRTDGQIDKAVKLLKHVVKVQEKLAEDHPFRLASQHELARVYRTDGQIDKAVKLLEHVVKLKEKLAEDHPSRLASQHELARVYRTDGQIDKAVKLLENVVKIREPLEHVVKLKEKLAEDHPSRLASQRLLASCKGSIIRKKLSS